VTERLNRPARVPDPVVAPLNEGMWRAAAAGRLDVQRCRSCGAHRYPPTDGCYRCGSLEWEWFPLPGTGVIYTYTWVPDRSRSTADGFYNVAVVTLDGAEGDPVRILTNVIDAWEVDDLAVGDAVTVAGVEFAPGLGLPCFRRLAGPASPERD
jgi:uncharacterized OB-fold protein